MYEAAQLVLTRFSLSLGDTRPIVSDEKRRSGILRLPLPPPLGTPFSCGHASGSIFCLAIQLCDGVDTAIAWEFVLPSAKNFL